MNERVIMSELNIEQQRAFDLAVKGASFFMTGPGGVGKTYLIEKISQELDSKYKTVATTALTGCAALLLGRKAKTLHSWAGIGLGREATSVLIAKIKKFGNLRQRWRSVDTLIIDEVSMLTPELLEKLNDIAQALRRNSRPMGGIQCIFVGDFFQLPPVNKGPEDTIFVFESPVWRQCVATTVELTQIVRQTDPVFHTILNEARKGILSNESMKILQNRQGLKWKSLEIRPTLLFSRKAAVDQVNAENFKKLQGDRHTYKVKTTVSGDNIIDIESTEVKFAIRKLDHDAPYIPELTLAVGAQVMLLTNMNQEQGLVNGSRGIVTDFGKTAEAYPIVKFRNGMVLEIGPAEWACDDFETVKRQQVPLALAYAVTIHKSQGTTLDCALIDIGSSTFECGQAYVALSRVKSLDSLYIWELEKNAFITHDKVHEFYEQLATQKVE
jgi:ATP-dependent DNA helicase PIF1